MKALVVAQKKDAALDLCADARSFADEVVLVTFDAAPFEAPVADKIVTVEVPAGYVLDDAAETVIAIVAEENPGAVLVEASRQMKVIAGRVAHRNKTAVVTDLIALADGQGTKMYYGGSGLQTLKPSALAVFTLGSKVTDAQASGANATSSVAFVEPAYKASLVSEEPIIKTGADLTKSSVVVGAGRGFTAEEKLENARQLADKIGAGLGCTRPLTEGVDWMPRESYIGVSGLMLAPDTYVALGISGQMQHMVGVNRAGTIFAINKDKNAPIFKQCDYGLVGDVDTVLPELLKQL